jgi:hypothetical protein
MVLNACGKALVKHAAIPIPARAAFAAWRRGDL